MCCHSNNKHYPSGATVMADSAMIAKRRLSSETLMISSILKTCASEMEIVAALPSILQFCASSAVVDEELRKLLQMHQESVERLEKLESQQQETDEAKRSELLQLRGSIVKSGKDVVMFFQLHPDVFLGLKKQITMEAGEYEQKIIRMLQLYHKYWVEYSRSDREPDPRADLVLDKLISAEAEEAATLKELTEKLRQLDIKLKQEENISVAKDEILAEQERRKQENEFKTAELDLQLSTLRQENWKKQMSLHEKNESMRREIKDLLKQFDKDMTSFQAKLELSQQVYDKEQGEMMELEKSFPVLEKQYNDIMEIRRLEEEKKEEMKTKAAIMVETVQHLQDLPEKVKKTSKAKKTRKTKKTRKP
ncbi:golgin subfamily A member 6-like protein 22 isoform X2 [Cyprinodon tularosa]|uniref:golgin subfamily A member 6-like protein 22 isoform X2 n=1 Tax=Cyprinodon tularosa TaxID=77115 RepID=UPI0018E26E60|nr:golgin subfamily A member 6-like protein 22 isoform X2 [Cyprinodon tularosa]